jgi:phasin family protein
MTDESLNQVKEATAKAAEQARENYESMASAGNQAMKDSMERSIETMGQIGEFNKENFDAVVASANASAKNSEAIATEQVAFAKKQIEDVVEVAKSALSAKSMQDLFELYADYTKKTFDAFVQHSNAMNDRMIEATKESSEPIQGRVTAFVEQVQNAR